MNYLLDTNVVSELRKRSGVADPAVVAWARRQRPEDLYLSVVTVMEIDLGVSRIERRDPDQGATLRHWLNVAVLGGFHGRILPVDLEVVRRCVPFHVPDPRPDRDAWIAATAAAHGLTVVTRNTSDFISTGVALLDPWTMTG